MLPFDDCIYMTAMVMETRTLYLLFPTEFAPISCPKTVLHANPDPSQTNCIQTLSLSIPIDPVEHHARRTSTHSWEHGTLSETLLELHNLSPSVFSNLAFPADKVPPASDSTNATGLSYAKQFMRLDNETLTHDSHSVSDPSSLGISAIMHGQSDVRYLSTATR